MITGTTRDLATASGLDLARRISELSHSLPVMSDAERLELVKATARLDAWTATIRAQAILAVHDSAREDITATTTELLTHQPGHHTAAGASHAYDDKRLLHRRLGLEVALVLSISTVAADREVDLALALRAHPQVRQALADGLIHPAQARVILDGTDLLDDPTSQAQLVTAILGPDDTPDSDHYNPEDCPDLDPWTETDRDPIRELRRPARAVWSLAPGRLRSIVRREVADLAPDALKQKARQVTDARHLTYHDLPDCGAELTINAPAPALAAAWRNLDRTARAAKTNGDTRTLDQLRTDIAIGWLTEGAHGLHITRPAGRRLPHGQTPDPTTTEICLPRSKEPLTTQSMAITTLLGLDDKPATLHGPTGPIPIPAEVARQLAGKPGTRWRRLLYDPTTGIATDLSHTYRPTKRMAAFVRSRDGHRTRLPISNATHLELDHIDEYHHGNPLAGGPTTPDNLASVGTREHHLKTDRLLDITGDANNTLTITTPSGRTYDSDPAQCADPWGEPPF